MTISSVCPKCGVEYSYTVSKGEEEHGVKRIVCKGCGKVFVLTFTPRRDK